jgi:hypothetical protein
MKIYDLQKTEDNKQIIIYKSLQYRWESTCDPQIEDIAYHLTYDEAEKIANEIDLNIGFYPVVDRIKININNIVDDEFELSELDNYRKYYGDVETIFEGNTNNGKEIIGSIIIEWSYEKYVGYCRNLLNIGIAGDYPFDDIKTESDLITGNEDSTFKSNYSVLLTAEDVKNSELQTKIEDSLSSDSWKWNNFKNNPLYKHICDKIDILCYK